jgi:diguanylate cyclase (GGDEF)-like protein
MILREGDILVRYVGEEFLAVLPAASTDDVQLIGERMRRAVEESSITEGQQTIRVTVSLGGSAYTSQNVEKAEALVQIADDALYRTKETGRNRLEIAR